MEHERSLVSPPHSVPAEQAVLGGLLVSNLAYDKVNDILRTDDFYVRDHRHLYACITSLIEDSHPADIITIGNRLGNLDSVGGLEYLKQLAGASLSTANIRKYAEIVRNAAVLRELIRVGVDLVDSSYEHGASAEERLADAHAQLIAISRAATTGPVELTPTLQSVMMAIDERQRSNRPITGISTGLEALDERWDGLLPGHYYVLGGRPSMGKTALAMQIGEYVAQHEGPVLIFSAEMGASQLAQRMLAGRARVPTTVLRRPGSMQGSDWDRIGRALATLTDLPIHIDERAAPEIGHIATVSRHMWLKHKIKLIIVDYLQLISARGENRTGEISASSGGLRKIAKELGVPVIAISQLSRTCESRTNKRPIMSDLREGGQIEQDADVVAFVYRDEVYNPDSPDAGVMEVITGKWRDGRIGTDRLAWLGEYTRAENLARDWAPRKAQVKTVSFGDVGFRE